MLRCRLGRLLVQFARLRNCPHPRVPSAVDSEELRLDYEHLQISAASMESRVGRFREGLRELGYVEGQNTTAEYRWAEGKQERLTDLAVELARLKVDVLVIHGMFGDPSCKTLAKYGVRHICSQQSEMPTSSQ